MRVLRWLLAISALALGAATLEAPAHAKEPSEQPAGSLAERRSRLVVAVRDRALFDEYRQKCEAGKAENCVFLGRFYERGWIVRYDPKRASELYERACNAGNALGCTRFGMALQSGFGVPKDEARAANL
jgi:TPR repeat protein